MAARSLYDLVLAQPCLEAQSEGQHAVADVSATDAIAVQTLRLREETDHFHLSTFNRSLGVVHLNVID